MKELLDAGCVQWESDPPKFECPHHFGVTRSSLWVMWPCMCWKEIRKGTAEFSRAHFSVFRGTLSIQLQQVFGAEVCGAQLLNLTGICISLEMGFSSEFLLLFRDGVAFSEGSEGQCKDNWRAVLQDLCNKEPCPVSLIRTDQ